MLLKDTPVELSVIIVVGCYWCPCADNVRRIGNTVLQLWKIAADLASAAEDTTFFSILHSMWIGNGNEVDVDADIEYNWWHIILH